MKATKDLCRQCGRPWVRDFERRIVSGLVSAELVARADCACGAETVRWTHELERAKFMLLVRWRDGYDLDAYVKAFDPGYESQVSRVAMALAYECGKRWGWFKESERRARPLAAATGRGLFG